MNQFHYIRTAKEVLDLKEFFLEGLRVLNDPQGGRGNVRKESYFQVILQTALGRISDGIVMLMTSVNDKPLGFVVLLNCTPPGGERTAFCYAVYSNGKCHGASYQMLEMVDKWARTYEYRQIQAASRRMTGSAVRLFDRWGFKPEAFLFRKVL